ANEADAARYFVCREPDLARDSFAKFPIRWLDAVPLTATPRFREKPCGHARELTMSCCGWQAHGPRVAPNVVLDVPPDPTGRIRRKPRLETVGIEPPNRGVQPKMPGADQVNQLDVALPVPHCDGNYQLTMAFPQLGQSCMSGIAIRCGSVGA